MSKEIFYTIMMVGGFGSILALGYAQYHLYKAGKHLDKAIEHLYQAEKYLDKAIRVFKSYKTRQR